MSKNSDQVGQTRPWDGLGLGYPAVAWDRPRPSSQAEASKLPRDVHTLPVLRRVEERFCIGKTTGCKESIRKLGPL